jgi:hypothetical protein
MKRANRRLGDSARWQSCPIAGSDERARAPFGIEARPLLAFDTILPEEK